MNEGLSNKTEIRLLEDEWLQLHAEFVILRSEIEKIDNFSIGSDSGEYVEKMKKRERLESDIAELSKRMSENLQRQKEYREGR